MPEIVQLVGMIQVAVGPSDDDPTLTNLIITDQQAQKQYIVGMNHESTQTIGKALLAPRVAQPPQGNLVLPR